jgi:hypothetical protein
MYPMVISKIWEFYFIYLGFFGFLKKLLEGNEFPAYNEKEQNGTKNTRTYYLGFVVQFLTTFKLTGSQGVCLTFCY